MWAGVVLEGGDHPVLDADRGAICDDAQADEVVADAAAQFPAQRVLGGHQQRVGAIGGQRGCRSVAALKSSTSIPTGGASGGR